MGAPVGLYVHVPFCASKCPYCDFYSLRTHDSAFMEAYAAAAEQVMEQYAEAGLTADSLYFGGGTPSVLPPELFSRLSRRAIHLFSIPAHSEITVECNPSSDLEEFLPAAVSAGVNRISLGMQSAVTSERKKLGRRADTERVSQCIALARQEGVENISLDIMLGVPGQTMESLQQTLQFCIDTGVPHISAYMLKLEKETFFFKNREKLNLPPDDMVSDMYLFTVETLREAGLLQYEISNFARPGYEGRHNLKYWHCQEYLGVGPGAHSYLSGKRFFWPRNLDGFVAGEKPVSDGDGGSKEEQFMLAMRLTEGYSGFLTPAIQEYIAQPGMEQFFRYDGRSLSFAPRGFLLSNYLLSELIGRL